MLFSSLLCDTNRTLSTVELFPCSNFSQPLWHDEKSVSTILNFNNFFNFFSLILYNFFFNII